MLRSSYHSSEGSAQVTDAAVYHLPADIRSNTACAGLSECSSLYSLYCDHKSPRECATTLFGDNNAVAAIASLPAHGCLAGAFCPVRHNSTTFSSSAGNGTARMCGHGAGTKQFPKCYSSKHWFAVSVVVPFFKEQVSMMMCMLMRALCWACGASPLALFGAHGMPNRFTSQLASHCAVRCVL